MESEGFFEEVSEGYVEYEGPREGGESGKDGTSCGVEYVACTHTDSKAKPREGNEGEVDDGDILDIWIVSEEGSDEGSGDGGGESEEESGCENEQESVFANGDDSGDELSTIILGDDGSDGRRDSDDENEGDHFYTDSDIESCDFYGTDGGYE